MDWAHFVNFPLSVPRCLEKPIPLSCEVPAPRVTLTRNSSFQGVK
jgi:hypothetical protein